MMIKATVLASILATLVTAGVAGATGQIVPPATGSVYETSATAPFTQVMLLPVDKNGNPYGKLGPWAYYFNLRNEPVQPPWVLESMAQQVAAYMKAHPGTELRIDGVGEGLGNSAEASGIRARRVTAIRTALINAGVPAENIQVGPR